MKKILLIIFLFSITYISYSQELKDDSGFLRGYIDTNGVVTNKKKKIVGYFPKENGTIQDGNHVVLGYLKNDTIFDINNKPAGLIYIDKITNRREKIKGSNHELLGYIRQDGTVVDAKNALIGTYDKSIRWQWVVIYYFFF